MEFGNEGARKAPLAAVARRMAVSAALLAVTATSCLAAAATLSQQIDPPEVNVGDEVTVTLTVQNGSLSNAQLPPVDGLQLEPGVSTSTNIMFTNGSLTSTTSESFRLIAIRAGDFTIPAFDIQTQDGQKLHAQAMKVHVVGSGSAPSPNGAVPAVPSPAPASPLSPAVTPFNPNGPVVMPPNNGLAPNVIVNPTTPNAGNSPAVPMDNDGRPAKVFVIITPETTDAYVGQAIPMRIEWYIRLDVDYQQDSLPTIKGSDFLMNSLSVHPQEEERMVMNEPYRAEGWVTAISAPKSGDFSLQMERDSYWVKSINNGNSFDPFNLLFNRPKLGHLSIPSNQLTIHVHALPTEGRPANFTGAIGQLRVTGDATPPSVHIGDPVTLNFTVSGEGNFDYVRCPTLADDTAWKSYVPSSKIEYQDVSHTQATKTFEQSIIPQKNGVLPLPKASFSYFDPTAKQYVTVPIALPEITVTGSPPPLASGSTGAASGPAPTAAIAPPQAAGFLPNRSDLGHLQTSLRPVWRQPWFWVAQGGLVALPLLGALFLFVQSRFRPDNDLAERTQRQLSLQQAEADMAEAVRQNDAPAFFLAARHVVQLQLSGRWGLRPEAITLDQMRERDPELAESLEPLFAQADEVLYSGQASSDLDLASWERQVSELLQPQPQPASV